MLHPVWSVVWSTPGESGGGVGTVSEGRPPFHPGGGV